MKNLLKLTDRDTKKIILIGSSNIIDVKQIESKEQGTYTVVRSVGAMVTTSYVLETPEQIHKQDCE